MREMTVDARVLALGMSRGWGPVSAAPLALQQNILTAFHLDQDAGDAVQAVQEVLNPAGGFADDVVHDDQGAFPGRLCNGGVERFNEGQAGFPDGIQGGFMLSPAHGQIIVHGENHDFLFQQKPQVPDQRAFSRAGGSVEQDDAPAPRSERFPFLRRRFFPVQAESASFLFPSRRVFPRSFMAFRTARGGVLIAVFRPAGSGPFHKGGGFLTGDAGWFPEDVGRSGHGRFMGIMNKKIRQGNHKNGSVRTEPPPFVACRAGPGGEELLTERLRRHGCRPS